MCANRHLPDTPYNALPHVFATIINYDSCTYVRRARVMPCHKIAWHIIETSYTHSFSVYACHENYNLHFTMWIDLMRTRALHQMALNSIAWSTISPATTNHVYMFGGVPRTAIANSNMVSSRLRIFQLAYPFVTLTVVRGHLPEPRRCIIPVWWVGYLINRATTTKLYIKLVNVVVRKVQQL